MHAGLLTERVTLEKRLMANPDAPDDFGNVVAEWIEQGTVAAQFVHLRGGESVMAGRLEGRHTQVIRVRASTLTRQVAADWRVKDARRGTEFAVRDVTPDPGRAFIDLLCEGGVAIG